MKIGIFCDHFMDIKQSIIGGGAGKSAYYTALELSKLGNRVTVFTVSSTPRDMLEKNGNMTIYRYARHFRIQYTGISFSMFLKPLQYDLDIVQAHVGIVALLAGLFYSKIKKRPIVISLRGHPTPNYGSLLRRGLVSFGKSYLIPMSLKMVDGIVALSNEFVSSSSLLKKYLYKIRVIPNGIDPNEASVLSKSEARKMLGIAQKEIIILFVGSLSKIKGPQVLLRSIPRVIAHFPHCKFLFVGPDRGLLKSLQSLFNERTHTNSVEFTGAKYFKDLTVYYRAADIFILPSFAEGFPNVLLEASLHSLPLIVSNIKELRAIVKDEYNGLLFSTGDEIDLSNKIIRLVKDQDLRENLGINAKEASKRFTWDKVAGNYLEIFLELL